MLNFLERKISLLRRTSLFRTLEKQVRFKGNNLIALGDTNSTFYRPGWQTCDLIDSDYIIDLRNSLLPFDDNSIDAIHSSHMIEHISAESGLQLFKEIYRCLKPQGVCRLSSPDMDLLISRYKQKDWHFFLEADGEFILQRICKGDIPPESILIHNRFIGWFASYSGRLDTAGGPISDERTIEEALRNLSKYEFRDWCVSLLQPHRIYAHIHLYDYEELYKTLQSIGFSTIRKVGYGESASPYMTNPVIDSSRHKLYSLYVECIKS
jgi:SAM-dependent methyltransferase